MDREVSQSASIAITMLAIAALISIVWVTLVIGNKVKFDAAETGSKVRDDIATSQLRSLKNKEGTILPMAAAYNILCQESGVINSLTHTNRNGNTSYISFVNDKWVSTGYKSKTYTSLENAIADSIVGKVAITVTGSDAGTFDVEIKELDY